SLMYQLCKGVAFGHGHGVLHMYSSSFTSNKVKLITRRYSSGGDRYGHNWVGGNRDAHYWLVLACIGAPKSVILDLYYKSVGRKCIVLILYDSIHCTSLS
ncbi:hypothetical protein FRX31_028531, partial [Thalictrum thalictroides]